MQAAWAINAMFAELRARWVVESKEFTDVDLGGGVTSGTVFWAILVPVAVSTTPWWGMRSIWRSVWLRNPSSAVSMSPNRCDARAVEGAFTVLPLGEMLPRGMEQTVPVFWVSGPRKERPISQ